MVPVISFNYAAHDIDRCRLTVRDSMISGAALMFLGTLCFEFLPGPMLSVFSKDPDVISIGIYGFRWIGLSFVPMVAAQIFPVFFQAIGYAVRSSALTIVRTVFLFVPLGYLFAQFGLHTFWLVFPVTEIITTLLGVYFYRQFLKANVSSGSPGIMHNK